jgi:hypothetical protein
MAVCRGEVCGVRIDSRDVHDGFAVQQQAEVDAEAQRLFAEVS